MMVKKIVEDRNEGERSPQFGGEVEPTPVRDENEEEEKSVKEEKVDEK